MEIFPSSVRYVRNTILHRNIKAWKVSIIHHLTFFSFSTGNACHEVHESGFFAPIVLTMITCRRMQRNQVSVSVYRRFLICKLQINNMQLSSTFRKRTLSDRNTNILIFPYRIIPTRVVLDLLLALLTFCCLLYLWICNGSTVATFNIPLPTFAWPAFLVAVIGFGIEGDAQEHQYVMFHSLPIF